MGGRGAEARNAGCQCECATQSHGGVLRRDGSACGGMEGGFANMRHACSHWRTFLRIVRMSKFCHSWISSLSSIISTRSSIADLQAVV